MKFKNLGDMFFSKRNTYADKTAYMFKKEGVWQEVIFKEAVDKAEKISAGFASLGIKRGDAIAIISQNRIEWALSDYAAVSLGALLIPIYPSLLPNQVKYILNDSEAKVVPVACPRLSLISLKLSISKKNSANTNSSSRFDLARACIS